MILVSQVMLSQTFTAKVSKTTLGIDERLRIQFSFNDQGLDDFTPPNFQNFKIVQGPSRSTNFYNYNGKKTFKLSYTYILQPKAIGKFVIPSATATYNDKKIVTNTIKITVNKGKKTSPKQQQITGNPTTNPTTDFTVIANENIHLIAEVSNTNPFVGESISIVYKLYMNRNNAAISNERESKAPTYNGFWNQNIPIKQLTEKKGTYNGKQMSYYVLRKDVLIPQQIGKLTLTPLEIDATVVVAIGKRDFFNRRMQKSLPLVFSTGNRTINVKALPNANKPSNFSGAVGDFAFKVNSTKKVIKANESAQIKVTLQGNGNLKLISLPKIVTPKGLELFEPEHKEKIRTRLSGLTGSITDIYTVVPQYRGKYKVPSLAFSFFNPKTKQYKTLNSAALVLNVPDGKMFVEDNQDNVVSGDNTISDSDIRSIHTKTSLVPLHQKNNFFKSNLFWMLLLLPLLAIPFGIYIGKKKQARDGDVVGNKRRKANKLAKKYLFEAKKELGNKEPFYIALEKALHNYLKAKLQVETSEISKEKISNLLQKRQVDKAFTTTFIKVLDDCDFARYTPTSNLQMEQEYNNAVDVITNLDKQL